MQGYIPAGGGGMYLNRLCIRNDSVLSTDQEWNKGRSSNHWGVYEAETCTLHLRSRPGADSSLLKRTGRLCLFLYEMFILGL